MTEPEWVSRVTSRLPMTMPMVKVGGMRVFMSNRVVLVNMRMRFDHRTLMPMPVVLIVNVQMVVLDRSMGVSVNVRFPDE